MHGNGMKRWGLSLLAGATLLQVGTCGGVVETIRLAFEIVNVWV